MEVQTTGLEEALRSLARLNIEEELENKAINKAGRITRDAVKQEAPEGKGDFGVSLKDSIKFKRAKDGAGIVHSGDAYHAHILEGGRSAGSKMALKNGKRQRVTWGHIPANPFFTRGFERSKNAARQAMIDEIRKGLNL